VVTDEGDDDCDSVGVTDDDTDNVTESDSVGLEDGVGAGVDDGNGNVPSTIAVQCNANVPTALPYPSMTMEYDPASKSVSTR
jgi:hypothetical protein